MDKTFRRTLRVKLLIVIVLGLVIAILTFFGGMFLLDRYVSSVYMSSDHTSRRSAKQIQSFAFFEINGFQGTQIVAGTAR